jgi:hypothetical protein
VTLHDIASFAITIAVSEFFLFSGSDYRLFLFEVMRIVDVYKVFLFFFISIALLNERIFKFMDGHYGRALNGRGGYLKIKKRAQIKLRFVSVSILDYKFRVCYTQFSPYMFVHHYVTLIFMYVVKLKLN